jgi:hypothetical protein
MKKLFTTLTLLFICYCSHAQEILPNELFQVYKFWMMDIKGFDKNTYDYIQTVDKQWELRIPPQRNDNGVELLMGYYKDKVWYKDEECKLMLTLDRSMKSPKGIMYQFTEFDTWQRFKRQMQIMNATSLLTKENQGGMMSVFEVNDILIYLTEFPPGINGVDRVYQVLVTQK